MQTYFYPRPPRGGRQRVDSLSVLGSLFLSTPSARRATFFRPSKYCSIRISIHALREEGDDVPTVGQVLSDYFYPRPPRGGRPPSLSSSLQQDNFYPRPPRGGRPGEFGCTAYCSEFLSTPSARRATRAKSRPRSFPKISIHALREEGDPRLYGILVVHIEFLSTPSARRATRWRRTEPGAGEISIHALREEGDGFGLLDTPLMCGFLSTPSARRATRELRLM